MLDEHVGSGGKTVAIVRIKIQFILELVESARMSATTRSARINFRGLKGSDSNHFNIS